MPLPDAPGASTMPAASSPQPGTPKLLVSVRNVVEAREAIAGGCDILDVKEPRHGALGRPDADVLEEILRELRGSPLPVSAAFGEAAEWETDEARCIPAAGALTYAKLGLAGWRGCPDWPQRWMAVWRRIEEGVGRELQWIAVAYADDELAHAPPLSEVVEAAIAYECAGLLVDTWSKRAGRLLDFVTTAELHAAADRVHAAGLLFAVAGRLNLPLLSHLQGIPIEVLGIRTAACREGDRDGAVDSRQVAEFREAMHPLPSSPVA